MEEAFQLGSWNLGGRRDLAYVWEAVRPEALLAREGQDLPVNGREGKPELERPLLGHFRSPFAILLGIVGWQGEAGVHGPALAKAVPTRGAEASAVESGRWNRSCCSLAGTSMTGVVGLKARILHECPPTPIPSDSCVCGANQGGWMEVPHRVGLESG